MWLRVDSFGHLAFANEIVNNAVTGFDYFMVWILRWRHKWHLTLSSGCDQTQNRVSRRQQTTGRPTSDLNLSSRQPAIRAPYAPHIVIRTSHLQIYNGISKGNPPRAVIQNDTMTHTLHWNVALYIGGLGAINQTPLELMSAFRMFAGTPESERSVTF